MKKIKEFIKKIDRKYYLIAGIVVIILIVGLIIVVSGKGKESESQKLSSELKNLGIDFYENFYYKQIGTDDKERKEFLEKYTNIGIKVSLDNLVRYKKDDTILEKFVNSKTKKECDKTSSMVVIYPKEPYGKNNYTIDAMLVCGFEEVTTK